MISSGFTEIRSFLKLVKEHPRFSGLSLPDTWEQNACKSHPKNVFWPNIFVGVSFKILDIQQYACGYKLGSAAILNQNPIFEMASGETLNSKMTVKFFIRR
jgi:hypothetical protein